MTKTQKIINMVHIHIENESKLGNVFDMNHKIVEEALLRNPEARKLARITVGYDNKTLETNLATANGLVGWEFPRHDLAQRAPKLRWVHSIGAGVNHYLPLDWLPKEVTFTNNRGVHGRRAAEYAITAVLMLNNRIPEMVSYQRISQWQQCFSSAIAGKSLLIVGVGHVGGDTAKLAKHFDMHVIGVRRTGKAKRHVDEMHKPDALRSLIPRADFVLIAAPDTDHTHHLFGREEIALMKSGAGLVNYSRAGLVDYDALCERLERREISAVLDVFDPEPLPSASPLWNVPNLIITPHSSSDDPDNYASRTLDLVLHNAVRLASGLPLENRVSRKLQY